MHPMPFSVPFSRTAELLNYNGNREVTAYVNSGRVVRLKANGLIVKEKVRILTNIDTGWSREVGGLNDKRGRVVVWKWAIKSSIEKAEANRFAETL